MPKVEIYTSIMCGYCTRAIRLLESCRELYALENAGHLDKLLAA